MTDAAGDWLGEVSETDVALLDSAPGGALSDAGRQAAIAASLGLLAVYFAAWEQDLISRSSGSRVPEPVELDFVEAGLRLRIALAASNRLMRILGEIADRPTFRYELQAVDEFGSLSGALDVNRWVTRSRGGDQELTYPVLEVQRGAHTPENVLATYAVLWLQRELSISLATSLATPVAVEHRVARQLGERLGRSLQLPLFAACAREAKDLRTSIALDRLLGQVRRRLQRREVFHPQPYRELVRWIDECLDGRPAVDSGDVNLALYGPQFDSKLFELWCLDLLGRELAHALNLPEPVVNQRWRRGAAAYSFENFSGRIEVFFQRSISAVDGSHAGRWVKDNGRRLGGIPDIVVRARPISGDERLAVLDPKLRQRDRLPAEEIYKILGYLENFGVEPTVGGVLIYTTDAQPREPDVFHDGAGGTLIATSLNPAASVAANQTALRQVVATILSLIDATATPTSAGAGEPLDDDERTEGAAEGTRLALVSWGNSHLSEIRPSRERIEALIGSERWVTLNADVQVMMATADLVGSQLEPAADFSGPVIGMSASIEHLIYSTLVSPIVLGHGNLERQMRTFGAAVDAIDLASHDKGGVVPRGIKARMDHLGLDPNLVGELVPLWRRLNTSYRVPAAHRELLSRASWQQVYRLVIGAEALFVRTHDTLAAR